MKAFVVERYGKDGLRAADVPEPEVGDGDEANGGQLRELGSLYDAGHLRPLIDKMFPFEETVEALAYAEQGRANGKVVITLD
jgi:NADPH:quinone reductase-like Zn-dependent oxidoreductase